MQNLTEPNLVEKFIALFVSFQAYWKENFSNFDENDFGERFEDFQLGARIRYGLLCAARNQPVPDDCSYDVLLEEVDGWICYREGNY